MKILLVANINSTHTKKWALALKDKNIKVALFSLNPVTQNNDWYKSLDLVYYPFERKTVFVRYFNLYIQLRKYIRMFAPDIVHSHFITNYSFIVNLTRFKNHVITAWGSDVFLFPKQNRLNKSILKYNLSRAKAIISTSYVMAKELQLYTSKPIQVIPFGVDFKQFHAKEKVRNPKKFNIGYFKKIESVYAPDILVRAFKTVCQKLPNYDLTLTLAGDGSQTAEIKELVSELNLEKKVVFSGWIDPKNVAERLQQTDICVYLSRRESFGVALLEAMASKIPLVVSRAVGFVEVAGRNHTVLFVEIDNVEQAAEQIIKLITDPTLYKSLAASAYDHALKYYSLTSNVTAQINLYESILKEDITLSN